MLSISRYASLLLLNGHRSGTSSRSFTNSGKKNFFFSILGAWEKKQGVRVCYFDVKNDELKTDLV